MHILKAIAYYAVVWLCCWFCCNVRKCWLVYSEVLERTLLILNMLIWTSRLNTVQHRSQRNKLQQLQRVALYYILVLTLKLRMHEQILANYQSSNHFLHFAAILQQHESMLNVIVTVNYLNYKSSTKNTETCVAYKKRNSITKFQELKWDCWRVTQKSIGQSYDNELWFDVERISLRLRACLCYHSVFSVVKCFFCDRNCINQYWCLCVHWICIRIETLSHAHAHTYTH